MAQSCTTSGRPTAAETPHGQKIPNQQGVGEDRASSTEEERGTSYQTTTEKLQRLPVGLFLIIKSIRK